MSSRATNEAKIHKIVQEKLAMVNDKMLLSRK
jgi:hypothetical protein